MPDHMLPREAPPLPRSLAVRLRARPTNHQMPPISVPLLPAWYEMRC